MTDVSGNAIFLNEKPQRVVALQGSIASTYVLSGGSLVGITDDYTNYGLEQNDATLLGTNHSPNLELIISLNPDLVLYTSTYSGQLSIKESLTQMNIPCFDASTDTFEDYLFILNEFTKITGRTDLYKINGTDIKDDIIDIISNVPTKDEYPTVIFIRARSAGFTTFASNNFVTDMLDNLKVNNLAKADNTLLENLSLEAIVEKDPDYILFTYMGASSSVEANIEAQFTSKEVWKSLKAYKNNHIIVLEERLYQYKPNNRWNEAYEKLFDLFYHQD